MRSMVCLLHAFENELKNHMFMCNEFVVDVTLLLISGRQLFRTGCGRWLVECGAQCRGPGDGIFEGYCGGHGFLSTGQ